jgi:fatty acid desaturase
MRAHAAPGALPPFRVTDALTREEIRALLPASNPRGLAAVASTWAGIAIAFAAVALWPSPGVVVAAVVFLGARQLALGILMHEAAHRTLLVPRRLNDFVGEWLCAKPIWSDLAGYRDSHLRHHRFNGTPTDPDLPIVSQFPTTPAGLVMCFLRDLLGVTAVFRLAVTLLVDFGFLAFSASGEGTPLDQRTRSAWEVVGAGARSLSRVAIPNLAIFGVLWAVGHPGLYLLWWVAWATTMQAFFRIRAMLDHACTPDAGDPLRNSRTTGARLWERLTVSPHRVNYHLEHHLLMTVPFFNLPRLHALLRDRGALAQACVDRGSLTVLARAAAGSGTPPAESHPGPPRPPPPPAYHRREHASLVAYLGGEVTRRAILMRRGP